MGGEPAGGGRGGGGGAVDVEGFARARARELGGLGAALGAAGGARGWGAGGLPRGLRRRARSHAPRRGGQGRRPNAKRARAREAGEEPPPEPRAARRRRARLQGEPAPPSGARLETHLWAAKRLSMGTMGGLVVAEGWAGRGRGGRHLRHVLDTGCCLLDGSFYAATELAGPRDEVLAALALLGGVPREGLEASSGEVPLTLRRLGAGGPRQAICPATVSLGRPGSTPGGGFAAWIWVHRAAEDEALEAIGLACEGMAVSATPRRESLRRLELRGRAAGARLAAALGRAAPSGRLDAAGCLERAGKAGETVFLEAPDPRLSDPGEARLLQKAGSPVGGLWAHEALPSPPSSQAALDSARKDLRGALLLEESRLPAFQKSLEEKATSPCPLALVRKAGISGATAGWSLILPRGWVMPFWHRLVLAGAVPCGQREWRWAASIDGAGSFPYDYPDTAAFMRTERARVAEAERELLRKPKGKRGGKGLPRPSSLSECVTDQGEGGERGEGEAGEPLVVSSGPTVRALLSGGDGNGSASGPAPHLFVRGSLQLCGRGTASPGDTVHFPASPSDEAAWREDPKVSYASPPGAEGQGGPAARPCIGFVSSALPPGLDRNHAHVTALCSARALWSARGRPPTGASAAGGATQKKTFVLVRCGRRSGISEGTVRPAFLRVRAETPDGDRAFV